MLADGHDGFPPITWEVEPPRYHWGPRRDYEKPANARTFTPELGQAWYSGWRGPAPSPERIQKPLREVPLFLQIAHNNLRIMRVTERLRECAR
jgi:hypothetical protein